MAVSIAKNTKRITLGKIDGIMVSRKDASCRMFFVDNFENFLKDVNFTSWRVNFTSRDVNFTSRDVSSRKGCRKNYRNRNDSLHRKDVKFVFQNIATKYKVIEINGLYFVGKLEKYYPRKETVFFSRYIDKDGDDYRPFSEKCPLRHIQCRDVLRVCYRDYGSYIGHSIIDPEDDGKELKTISLDYNNGPVRVEDASLHPENKEFKKLARDIQKSIFRYSTFKKCPERRKRDIIKEIGLLRDAYEINWVSTEVRISNFTNLIILNKLVREGSTDKPNTIINSIISAFGRKKDDQFIISGTVFAYIEYRCPVRVPFEINKNIILDKLTLDNLLYVSNIKNSGIELPEIIPGGASDLKYANFSVALDDFVKKLEKRHPPRGLTSSSRMERLYGKEIEDNNKKQRELDNADIKRECNEARRNAISKIRGGGLNRFLIECDQIMISVYQLVNFKLLIWQKDIDIHPEKRTDSFFIEKSVEIEREELLYKEEFEIIIRDIDLFVARTLNGVSEKLNNINSPNYAEEMSQIESVSDIISRDIMAKQKSILNRISGIIRETKGMLQNIIYNGGEENVYDIILDMV